MFSFLHKANIKDIRNISMVGCVVYLFLLTAAVSAETIVLKSGEKIEGKITERNARYIKIDYKGAVIIYHTFEIKSIDGKDVGVAEDASLDKTLQFILKKNASEEFPEGVSGNFVSAQECLGRGVAYYNNANFDQAVSEIGKAIKINPKYTEAYLYLGLAYMGKQELDKAILNYDKAIEINPKNEEAYNVRGVAYANKCDYDKAIRDYDEAIKIKPGYVQAYLNRGFVNISTRNFEQVISDSNRVISINPAIATAYYLRGLAYTNEKNMEQAISDYGKAIEINPKYVDAYLNRGLTYAYKGKMEQLKNSRVNLSAYIDIGLAVTNKDDFDHAIADCSKAIEIDPKCAEAYITRAKIYVLGNVFDKARSDAHKAEELGYKSDPDFIKRLRELSVKGK